MQLMQKRRGDMTPTRQQPQWQQRRGAAHVWFGRAAVSEREEHPANLFANLV
jgi:hypothetical protein